MCTIVKDSSKRTKYTSNAVECLNREVFRVAEMRATTNLSRHADEIKTRTGLTHVAESGHGPKQAIAYQDATVNGGRGRETIESMQESLDWGNEPSESGDDSPDVVDDSPILRRPGPVPPAKIAAMLRTQDDLRAQISTKEQEKCDPNNVMNHIG